jgi:prevent-host-death family protein
MLKVGTYEAKTRLSELLERVAAGERVSITRHGEEVALLIPPVGREVRSETFAESVARWRKTRSKVKLNGLSVRALINEGRR